MLSFRTPFASFSAVPFDSNFNAFQDPIIAPFWADYDVIDSSGSISYRRTADTAILSNVTEVLASRNPELRSYQPTLAFIATWNEAPLHDHLQIVSDDRSTHTQKVKTAHFVCSTCILVIHDSCVDLAV